jgi:hypothetical protein
VSVLAFSGFPKSRPECPRERERERNEEVIASLKLPGDENPVEGVCVFEPGVAEGEVGHFGGIYFVRGGEVEDGKFNERVVESAEL